MRRSFAALSYMSCYSQILHLLVHPLSEHFTKKRGQFISTANPYVHFGSIRLNNYEPDRKISRHWLSDWFRQDTIGLPEILEAAGKASLGYAGCRRLLRVVRPPARWVEPERSTGLTPHRTQHFDLISVADPTLFNSDSALPWPDSVQEAKIFWTDLVQMHNTII